MMRDVDLLRRPAFRRALHAGRSPEPEHPPALLHGPELASHQARILDRDDMT
jgi:hypothetical protein